MGTMKRVGLLFLALITSVLVSKEAQSYGYIEGSYYMESGPSYSQYQCSAFFVASRDYYGYPILCAQTCQQAIWQKTFISAGQSASVCNLFGCHVQYFSYGEYVWTYTWGLYTRPRYCY